MIEDGVTPVCIEVLDDAESLVRFDHPEHAAYVLGPEDGSVPEGVRAACHRFVRIPAVGRASGARCLNLAAAVNVVLYDRLAKASGPWGPAPTDDETTPGW